VQRDIVHVLDTLGRGGIETWLMHVLRGSPTVRARSVIAVTTGPIEGEATYRDEIDAMGVPVHRLGYARGFRFVGVLYRLLRRTRPTVVHAHMNHIAGWATAAGFLAGVPRRIAHYHITFPDEHRNLLHRTYIRLVRWLEALTATDVLSCSVAAMESYCGTAWSRDPRRRVLYYGIDLDPFEEEVDGGRIRASLGLPADAFVVGHVGRFDAQKNHGFIIDVAAATIAREPRTRLLLVGDGRLRPAIERLARERGIADKVVFAGVRKDVSRLMLGAMDVFFFPSRFEGLGIVLIEAQAAGLPCVFSDTVPAEAALIPVLTRQLPLSEPADVWARSLLGWSGESDTGDRRSHLAQVRASAFDIRRAIGNVESLYSAPRT
jgi:glycosyltransferase involved in cell wall biosynthesis